MKSFVTTNELMPHQLAAVQKVLPSRVGALFMEMGTGKSRTAIELVRIRHKKIDKVVWFCPVSLKDTVRGEILKHTDCQESDICVFDDKIIESTIPDVGWYIVGIESMSASARVVFAVNKLITDKTFVILDESSYCKNHRAKRTERITKLSERARYRLMLTGTPLSQGVVDLYAQMRFLSPKILGYSSFYSFAANHLEYSDKFPGMIVRAHNIEYLAAKIKPYIYQVTKKEAISLPTKLYYTQYFSFTHEQSEWYERAKEEVLYEMDSYDNPYLDRIRIFRLFSILQQIASGFWNRNGELIEFDHNRLEALIWALRETHGEKTIIWTKFHYDVKIIGEYLESVYGAENVAYLHGGIPGKKRRFEIEKFKKNAQFLIATHSTGGHGFTLNEAKYVIFYNNVFKYSERIQAEDRCHRIGQDKRVTYIDIHLLKSIDDRIAKALSNKESVIEEFRGEVEKIKESGKKERLKELIKSL